MKIVLIYAKSQAIREKAAAIFSDDKAVNGELAFARRLFADNGWPVIDVTRRSIEESALAIVKLYGERLERAAE